MSRNQEKGKQEYFTHDYRHSLIDIDRELAIIDYEIAVEKWKAHKKLAEQYSPND